jgi:hypothetical protein
MCRRNSPPTATIATNSARIKDAPCTVMDAVAWGDGKGERRPIVESDLRLALVSLEVGFVQEICLIRRKKTPTRN